ncbi:TonB-dependent receptor [Cellulophaga baltica]|uniref:TonB-dependent receptor n=1 Tax=Cellulophaga TaxID=104264 RepID=UPI001C07882C|nr:MULTISPECIES: TonB-dependent receptor [Cellulophaga]MBU2997913.1 TonB-dependent receptor [Cellulophaga baltica]MDO6769314.1 TonB-dependent receptor [Cellulophaga sp. 1_MG-2023]
MKRAIFCFFILFACIISAQTTPTLSGYVKNSNNSAVAYAHVELIGTDFKSITNDIGYYSFSNLNAGDYTLRISYMGKHTVKRKLTIIDKVASTVNIVMQSEEQRLDEVLVTGNEKPHVTKEESVYVARLPITNMENPQVYSTVSKELMKTQVITDLDGALKNVVGAGVPIRYNQNRIVFASRGFQVEPKIRNGLTTFNQNVIDPVNLERIEVLKGPSATLFGSSEVSYGGLLNRITKKPFKDFGGSIAYNGGSWNLNRVTFDVNTPLNKSKTLLFRLNGAVHAEKSFQDAGFYNDIAFTPSVTYEINDKTTLNFDLEYTKSKGTSPVRHSPDTDDVSVRSAEDFIDYYETSYTSNDVYYTGENIDFYGEIKHELSDTWTSSTSFARTQSLNDGYTSRIDGRSEDTFRARVYSGYYKYSSTNIQQNFTGEFNIGSFRNRLVAGINYYNYFADRDVSYINTSDFEYGSTDYYNEFNKSYIDSAMVDGTRTFRTQNTNTYSAYVSDVVNVTDRLLAMLSLRYDYFDDEGTVNLLTNTTSGSYNQGALSPKLGLVYQVFPKQLSIFGNYMNGFANQSGSDENGDSFDPEHANQLEGGIKFNLLKNKISGSISYYDIEVENILREDPDNSDFSVQDGTQTSEGIEFELMASPIENLNLLLGYSYNKSELQNTENGEQDGYRPATAGPESLLNWWLDYSVPFKNNNKLLFGLGGNYGSDSFQTNTVDATVTIPSYNVLDCGVTYKVSNTSFGVKLNNITNEKYWSYRLAPQKLRNVVANFSFNF